MAPKKTNDSKTQLIALRLPATLMKRVAKFEKTAGKMSQSDALRSLIEAGLDAREQRAATAPLPGWVAEVQRAMGEYGIKPEGLLRMMRAPERLEENTEQLAAPDAPSKPAGDNEPAPPADKAKPKKGTKLFGII